MRPRDYTTIINTLPTYICYASVFVQYSQSVPRPAQRKSPRASAAPLPLQPDETDDSVRMATGSRVEAENLRRPDAYDDYGLVLCLLRFSPSSFTPPLQSAPPPYPCASFSP